MSCERKYGGTSKVIFHRAEVENNKQSYQENDDLVFFLNVNNRALMKNSVRLEGELCIRQGTGADVLANRIITTDDIYIDNVIGVNSIISNISCDFQKVGLVEQFSDYSRYVKMSEIGEKDTNDYHSGQSLCELVSPSEQGTQSLLGGYTSLSSGAVAGDRKDIDFSFKPRMCLNKMNDDLSFTKTGQIKLSLRLNAVNQTLYGKDCFVSGSNTGTTYYIKNVRLLYKSVPDEMNNVMMKTILSLKSSINSQLSNTSASPSAIVSGVSCCFLRQDKENDLVECATSMDMLSGINELQFIFQDSTSEYISYVIDTKSEMLDKFIESLEHGGHNQVNSNRNLMNFGIGLTFPPTDLSNQKFNIQINTKFNTLSTTPYSMYQYFHSVVSI